MVEICMYHIIGTKPSENDPLFYVFLSYSYSVYTVLRYVNTQKYKFNVHFTWV